MKMKKYIIILLLATLCVFSTALLSSCANYKETVDVTETACEDQTDDNDPFTFSTVSELKNAIKKNPKFYCDKEIAVKGTAVKMDNGFRLVDFNGSKLEGMERYAIRTTSSYIAIIIPDDILLSVLETGDYISLNGIVGIAEGEIYLDDCEYAMIETQEERSR